MLQKGGSKEIIVLPFFSFCNLGQSNEGRSGMAPSRIGRVLLQEPAYQGKNQAVLDPYV